MEVLSRDPHRYVPHFQTLRNDLINCLRHLENSANGLSLLARNEARYAEYKSASSYIKTHIKKMKKLVIGGFNNEFLTKLHYDGLILSNLLSVIENVNECRRILEGN